MEEGLELARYLPVSFQDPQQTEYIDFLWDAYKTNYEKDKYQFAYLSLHMLFMSFVYFNVWQIKHNLSDDFIKAIVFKSNERERDLLQASSPFVFHIENESSIFSFLKLIGCDKQKIGKYKSLVKQRNEIAHTNGVIHFKNEESHISQVNELIRCTEEIQEYSKPVIQEIYKQFLIESWDEKSREYIDLSDQIREALVHTYYFSEADIQFCVDFDIESLEDEEHYEDIQSLHAYLCSIYSEDYEKEYCEVCSENERISKISFWPGGELIDERDHGSVGGEIEIAECGYCASTHFKCIECGTSNAVWDYELGNEKECEGGCGLTYLINDSFDSDYISEGYTFKVMQEST